MSWPSWPKKHYQTIKLDPHVKLSIQQKRSNAKQQTNYFSSSTSESSNFESSFESQSVSDTATVTDDNTSEDSIKQGFQLAPPIAKNRRG